MGAECSVDRNTNTNYDGEKDQETRDNPSNISNQSDQTISSYFEFRNYKDYYNKMDLLKIKIKEIRKKVEITNDFSIKKE
jgi:hypothetical protein